MGELGLRGVSKDFAGGVRAVDNLTLQVHNGEFLVLLGPSGCGKTTLLRMIAGLEDPSSGEIYIDDQVVNFVPAKNRDVAMVFQNYALYPHMDVEDNITLGLRLRKISGRVVRERLASTTGLLGIEGLLKRMPRQLSGGQQQRVAVGRAIIREPKAFLMDEPLSNLDSRLRVRTRTELIKLHRKLATTVVYVTHDQSEAMTMATRIAVMRDGAIQQCDSPSTIYRSPANKFVAAFVGNPEMNFLQGRVLREGEGWAVAGPGFKVVLPPERSAALAGSLGRSLWLGIRPEAIRLGTDRPNDASVPAMVDVIEPLGGRNLIYCLVGDNTVVVDAEADVHPNVRDRVHLAFDLRMVYAFEVEPPERAVW